jgi:hypothetical protein
MIEICFDSWEDTRFLIELNISENFTFLFIEMIKLNKCEKIIIFINSCFSI